jgi:NAD(P)-dependent dehydrogenase (short-subunit alcohol dehydrogenase family)
MISINSKQLLTINDMKTVVITGAGSGLGRNLALEFASRGYNVMGTAINKEEIADLNAASDGKVTLTECNIVNHDDVKHFAAEVNRRTNNRVNILISNAGVLTPGPLETVTTEEARREFDVNTFGVLAVVNAFLPALRAAHGRIVQVSTMSVDFPSPFNGLSAASKAAAEAFMTVYQAELAASGVSVTTAVCGNMRTGGPAKTAAAIAHVRETFTPQQAEVYGAMFDRFATRMNTGQAGGMEAAAAARQIADLAERTPASLREPVGEDARALLAFVKQSTTAEQAERRQQSIRG